VSNKHGWLVVTIKLQQVFVWKKYGKRVVTYASLCLDQACLASSYIYITASFGMEQAWLASCYKYVTQVCVWKKDGWRVVTMTLQQDYV